MDRNNVARRIHDIDELGNDAKRFASSPGAKTHKYYRGLRVAVGYGDLPRGWKETIRYEPEGFLNEEMANSWLQEAIKLYSRIIKMMEMDGII